MIKKEQLNILALKAQRGDTYAMWEIKSHFHNTVHRLSEANRNRIVNQSSFEEGCFKIIESTVLRFNPERGELPQLVMNFIKRRLGQESSRYRKKTKDYVIEQLSYDMSDDGYSEIQLEDDLAIVDGNILLNERITGLAAGDPRKLAILISWTESDYCESDTALLLAKQFGGKSETHRKSITRLRTQCRKALAHAN